MRNVWMTCPPERAVINKFMADNNFGDFYTRTGLDNRERELMTFCYIYAQGGPDTSTLPHVAANIRAGNSKDYLYAVLNANVAWVGYPRTLAAMNCIDQTK